MKEKSRPPLSSKEKRARIKERAQSGDVGAILELTHRDKYRGLLMAREQGPDTVTAYKRKYAIYASRGSANGETPSTPQELGIGSQGNDLSEEHKIELLKGFPIDPEDIVIFLKATNALQREDE